MTFRPLADLGLLVLRVVLGVIFVAHGWQKCVTNGFTATGAAFDTLGVPFAAFSGPAIGLLELFCGAGLVVGILTRPCAVLIAATSIGAIVTVAGANGFFAATGGFEYLLLLTAAAGGAALLGAGGFSLDALLRRSSRGRLLRTLAA